MGQGVGSIYLKVSSVKIVVGTMFSNAGIVAMSLMLKARTTVITAIGLFALSVVHADVMRKSSYLSGKKVSISAV